MGQRGTLFRLGPVLLSRQLLGALALMLATDGLFVIVHAIRFICLRFELDGGLLLDPLFSIETQGGFAELFGYLKILGLVGLLVQLGRHSRQLVHLAFAGVFFLVLVDEATGLDQVLGSALVPLLQVPAVLGLPAQSMAELILFAGIGLPLAGLLAWAMARATPEHRRIALGFALLAALLALFAIVVDLIHIAYMRAFSGSRLLFEVLEEGGEMATLSLAFAFAWALHHRLTAGSHTAYASAG